LPAHQIVSRILLFGYKQSLQLCYAQIPIVIYIHKICVVCKSKEVSHEFPRQQIDTPLIVDDHPLIRVGLRALFDKHTHLQIVGEAGNCADALAIAVREHPILFCLISISVVKAESAFSAVAC
jgi:hypothetical protein